MGIFRRNNTKNMMGLVNSIFNGEIEQLPIFNGWLEQGETLNIIEQIEAGQMGTKYSDGLRELIAAVNYPDSLVSGIRLCRNGNSAIGTLEENDRGEALVVMTLGENNPLTVSLRTIKGQDKRREKTYCALSTSSKKVADEVIEARNRARAKSGVQQEKTDGTSTVYKRRWDWVTQYERDVKSDQIKAAQQNTTAVHGDGATNIAHTEEEGVSL